MSEPFSVARVRVEPLAAHHEAAFLDGVAASQSLHAGLVTPPSTPAEFSAYLRRFAGESHRAFAVIYQVDDALVGAVALNEIVRGKFWSAYLGYLAFEPMQGRGLMREGLARVIDWAFGTGGLHRLEANLQPENQASRALVERLGFRKEGFSPRYLHIDGGWRDHERWALLSEDWQSPFPDA